MVAVYGMPGTVETIAGTIGDGIKAISGACRSRIAITRGRIGGTADAAGTKSDIHHRVTETAGT